MPALLYSFPLSLNNSDPQLLFLLSGPCSDPKDVHANGYYVNGEPLILMVPISHRVGSKCWLALKWYGILAIGDLFEWHQTNFL